MDIFKSVFRSKKKPKSEKKPEERRNNGSTTSHTTIVEASVPFTRDTSRGLMLLYEPSAVENAIVDIIFVHGLTGSSFSTWYNESNDMHWPTKLLKKDIPEARIFTFGYDADVASFWGGISQNRLSNHAENMIGKLSGEREGLVRL